MPKPYRNNHQQEHPLQQQHHTHTHTHTHTKQNFPESVEALGGLAVCQMEIGNNDEAVQAFSQVQA